MYASCYIVPRYNGTQQYLVPNRKQKAENTIFYFLK